MTEPPTFSDFPLSTSTLGTLCTAPATVV
jgi:hypothetical protein